MTEARRTQFKLDGPGYEKARAVVERLYGQGVKYELMPEIVKQETGKEVSVMACNRWCRERIAAEAERATRLSQMAEGYAKGLAAAAPADIRENVQSALYAIMMNLLMGADPEAQKLAAWTLRDLAKLGLEEKKLALSYAQLEQDKKALEAKLADVRRDGQQVIAEVEKAVQEGKPFDAKEILRKISAVIGVGEALEERVEN